MRNYTFINEKSFPTSDAELDAIERWLHAERNALASNQPMPDLMPSLQSWPIAYAGPDGVGIILRNEKNRPGKTPRIFDPAIALALRWTVANLGGALGLEAVRRDTETGGQLYPRITLGKGRGRNFKVARITKDVPEGKVARPTGSNHYDCRAQSLRIARPQEDHRDPYQNGKTRFIAVTLFRYADLEAMPGKAPRIERDRFERVLRGLLEVHSEREQLRAEQEPEAA